MWEGGVPPPTVGSFCIFGLQIVQSGAYLERKFRLKIYCIAWKATNLKIPKTERSVFWGFKTSKTEQFLASLVLYWKYIATELEFVNLLCHHPCSV